MDSVVDKKENRIAVWQPDLTKPPMSKNQLQAKKDAELLAMVSTAAGHTSGTAFKQKMHCNFSYSFLTDELRRRGYRTGWYKADDTPINNGQRPETITLHRPEKEGKRLTLTVSNTTAEEWHALIASVPFKQIVADEALERFMQDVKTGRIKLEVEIS